MDAGARAGTGASELDEEAAFQRAEEEEEEEVTEDEDGEGEDEGEEVDCMDGDDLDEGEGAYFVRGQVQFTYGSHGDKTRGDDSRPTNQ